MPMDDLESRLMIEKLKFCACGSPESVLDLLFKFIKLSQVQHAEKAPSFIGKEWDAYCNRQRNEAKNLIVEHWEAVRWLIYYVLDEKEIFTHGGNVSGGWLDDYEFAELLNQWNERQQKEEH